MTDKIALDRYPQYLIFLMLFGYPAFKATSRLIHIVIIKKLGKFKRVGHRTGDGIVTAAAAPVLAPK